MIETILSGLGAVVVILMAITGYMMKRWSEKIDNKFGDLSTELKSTAANLTTSFKDTCSERQHACIMHMEEKVDNLKSAVKYIHEDRQNRWDRQQDINESLKVHITVNGKHRNENNNK